MLARKLAHGRQRLGNAGTLSGGAGMNKAWGGVLVGAWLSVSGCESDADGGGDEGGDECPEIETTPPHWSYEGEEGPERWGEIDEAFALCEEGMAQSPIDLVSADATADASLGPLDIQWSASAHVALFNNGHTWQVNLDAGSTFTPPGVGVSYELKQFHVHAPSEHSLDGKRYPMEMHFVHLPSDASDATFAVIGVFFEEGKPNAMLDKVWSRFSMCPQAAPDAPIEMEFDPFELLPEAQDYYAYDGSLTVPACTEGGKWQVFATPVEASAEQIELLTAALGHTNRPVQALHGREVRVYHP
jgi:carbonic anhydrase